MGDEGNPLDRAEDLVAQGHAAEAADIVRALIDAGRGGLLARLLRARALIALGEKGQAVEAARDAAGIYPHAAQAALGLGEALLAAELLPAAIAELQRALRIDPALDAARIRLGEAWLAAGEPDRAREVLRDGDSTDEDLSRLLERAERMRRQTRSDPGYVRHLFDQFSADYDQRMRGPLAYRGPEILRELADLTGISFGRHAILDLGCGTGLAGMAFADIATRLDGVDLSPAMVAQARARSLYQDLQVTDLEAALQNATHAYDLIIAADTFVYLGDLAAVFEGCARALAPGGHLLFTVERSWAADFALGPKRRWHHSESYLRNLAVQAGFEIAGLVTCSPRNEAGKPVEGLAGAFRKAGLAEKVG